MSIKIEEHEEFSELSYDEDCLSRDFLSELLLEVYTRQVSIDKAVDMILDDVEYLKKNLIKG